MACTVPGCSKRVGVLKENNEKVSFHRFPVDIEMRNIWIKNVRKGDNWKPTQYTRICGLHFEESCFREGYDRKVLHSYAVPTIFSKQPTSCQPKLPSKRKLIAKYDDAVPSTSSSCEKQVLGATVAKINRKTQTDQTGDMDAELKKANKLVQHYKMLAIRRGRKLKNTQQKFNRLVKKKANLETIIQALHKKMEDEHVEILKNTIDTKNEIVSRYLLKLQGGSLPKGYPDEVKKFALTLHFLSPKAYSFVRDSFDTVLPHPKTLSRWYTSIDCLPGFTKESLDILKLRSACANKTLYCALVIDEVAIRKQLQWDGTKYYGHIDIGTEVVGDDLPLASEALTFMVTCINESWKIPVGYFLINGLSAQQKKNLIEQCLRLLMDSDVIVVSLTFDGAAANGAMAAQLGCNLNPAALKTTFNVDKHEVAILYDPCHNIKLIRNTLGEKKILLDAENNVISWNYLEMLHILQLEEGLLAANKLSAAHIGYDKQKMKVKLATQLLSNSVADALQFCLEMKVPGFEKCDATIKFIRNFNDLFDILNSRNLAANGYKKPLCEKNINYIKEKLLEINEYINSLKLSDGTSILHSRRKTGFIGFQICIKSVLFIYDKYIATVNPYLHFLPLYKLSQDHLEVFFGAIRSLGGFNNNPSAKAFMTAYKKLLVHAEFKISRNGNCLPLDDIRILHANKKHYIQAINETTLRAKMLDDEVKDNFEKNIDHDYIPDPSLLTEYSENVITYIAGFIVRRLKKNIVCEHCVKALTNDTTKSFLIKVKDRGGLMKPSSDVIYICKHSEKVFRHYLRLVGVNQVGKPYYMKKIIMTVFEICARSENTFSDLINHCYDNCVLNNHLNLIIKAVVDLYLKIRIHHECKKASAPDGEIVRNYYNKLVLFKGQ